MEDLAGRCAIVTGASRGIGPLIARALAQEGMTLVLAARTVEPLEALAAELGATGQRAIAVPTDLTQRDSLDALIEAAEAAFDQVDVLVNNAARPANRHLAGQDEAEMEQIIELNLLAGILLTRRLLPGMIARGRGQIVNLASLAGRVGSPYDAVYAAGKGGQIAFAQSLRAELHGSGVGVSVICPGFVSGTGMWHDRSRPAGVKTPRLAGASTPEAVAKAVVRAIKHNQAEVYLNRPPLRPLIALGELSPRWRAWFLRRIGVTKAFRRVAEYHERSQTSEA